MSCTLVTAFYNFPAKKYHTNNYLVWMKAFLENTNNNMIIYTDSQESADIISKFRENFKDITKIIIEPFQNLYCAKFQNYWDKDLYRDHERSYHNQMLYIIWNEKTMFMYKTYKMNPFNTEYYAWIDIGMVRNQNYIKFLHNFPSKKRIEQLDKSKVYLVVINKFTENELNSVVPSETFRYVDRLGAGMIMCHIDIIEKWKTEYYNMLELFMNNNLFSGKDQSIINSLYIKHKNKFIELVDTDDLTQIDNKWFYMLYFLSDYYISNN